MLGVTAVHVGATTLSAPTGFTVVSDNTLTFNAPQPSAFGSVAVNVEKPAGTSNSLNLTYVATDPPLLSASGLSLTGFAASFNFGAQADDLWFLLVVPNDSSTISFAGFNLLANPIFLSSGSLSTVGIGSFAAIVPPGLSGGVIYSQVALLDHLTFAFVGATNVGVTQIVL
jgi:hypothetical protein